MSDIYFDFEKMGRLLASFYTVSGVRYSLADIDNNLLCFSNDFSNFCNRINSSPEGHARCKNCDQNALNTLKSGNLRTYTYRCHAGLLETVIPIRAQNEIIAFIFFGQMLHRDNVAGQWRQTLSRLDWLEKAESYQEDFFKLKQIDEKTIESCSEILIACSSYILMEAVVKSAPKTEMQKLSDYLDEHYNQAPSLNEIAAALNMSKTKLCGLAARHNTTVNTMLTERQIETARGLLSCTDQRISEVAAMVGVRDYNYFSKLFKSKCGMSPSAYRRAFGPQRSMGLQP